MFDGIDVSLRPRVQVRVKSRSARAHPDACRNIKRVSAKCDSCHLRPASRSLSKSVFAQEIPTSRTVCVRMPPPPAAEWNVAATCILPEDLRASGCNGERKREEDEERKRKTEEEGTWNKNAAPRTIVITKKEEGRRRKRLSVLQKPKKGQRGRRRHRG